MSTGERGPEASYTRLRQLQSISDAALAHLRFDDLVDELLRRLTEILATDTAAVLLLDEEDQQLEPRAARGIEEEVGAGIRIPLGKGFAGRVAAERRALAVADVDEYDVVNPILRQKGIKSLLGAPLVVQGRVTGVLHVGTLHPRVFTTDDADLLQLAADRIAVAVDHVRLFEAEHEARVKAEMALDQLARIESITEVALHHIALDEEVLERLLSRVRAVLGADTAGLFVLDDATQVLVAAAPGGASEMVERRVSLAPGEGFAGLVAERREPVVLAEAGDVEVVSPLLRGSSISSLMGVPLEVEGRLLGVLHIGSLERRDFGDADLSLLQLAGERLAIALDRSRMYEREHFVAATLQRSLLPERLPDIPGASVASRYLPGEGEAVGGDWYDVIQLPDGRVALAMGDVVSRGVRAAAVMGQMRNALRAYAAEAHAPGELVGRLDTVIRGLEGREMATLVYAVYEPADSSITYVTAGHPPPLLLRPDGKAAMLDESRGPPLGAVPGAFFEESRAELMPGETLLLYTDGIVERRDMWVDEGIVRLRDEAQAAAGLRPAALLETLVGKLLGAAVAADDVALLALRVDPAPAGMLRLALPADPEVLAPMRQSLRRWLSKAGAGEEDSYDVLVAATEAAANAVEHAYGPGDASFDVEGRVNDSGLVTLVVRDRGSWRPPRGHNRGRGTLLMQELMDDFEVETGELGTEVRMAKRLAGAHEA
jgi:serine phosphatase RsbU (regulator of sigma subunit)/anti-sigma regulatory factor (Ser/Thr protein kinase)